MELVKKRIQEVFGITYVESPATDWTVRFDGGGWATWVSPEPPTFDVGDTVELMVEDDSDHTIQCVIHRPRRSRYLNEDNVLIDPEIPF